MANAGLELEVRTKERPLWIQGDPERLAQAIGNLLQNAAKFTSRGGHVQVALEEDAPRSLAVIRVRDDGAGIHGAGIHSDLLEHVFEPFIQADRTLDRSSGGLGQNETRRLRWLRGLNDLAAARIHDRPADELLVPT